MRKTKSWNIYWTKRFF